LFNIKRLATADDAMILLALLGSLLAHPPRERVWCGDPDATGWVMSKVVPLVTARGAAADAHRTRYAMPSAPLDSVIVVKDEAICERAARAYYRHSLGPIPAGGVSVVRVRNRYAVLGGLRAGEWSIMTIFSLQFDSIENVFT
jgi:hypothetical protein